MKKVVLITGSNGAVAKYLTKQLGDDYSIRFLTRNVKSKNEYLWDINNNYIDPKALIGVNYIIHLAGSSIVKKWTDRNKQNILSSRVDSSLLLLEEFKKHKIKIDAFISASAVGYYGAVTSEEIFNEKSSKGKDFLSDVCSQWENAAHQYKSSGVAARVSIARIGVILSKNSGFLEKIMKPIKYGLGSAIGTGDQYMPWIHIEDLCGIFRFILNNKHIDGTFNAVAPEHITNIEITKRIGNILGKKIILPNIPKFVLKAIFGKMSIIFLEGSRVSSKKIIDKGYSFKYDTSKKALNNLLK